LKSQYKSSIGFFVNASSAVSESMSSQQTSFGGELASRSNSASDTYQKLNYITGMGTSGSFNKNRRTIGIAMTQINQASSYIQENFTKTTSALNSNSTGIGKLIKVVAGIALDTARISATEDFSSLIQSFAVTNGMKTIYPELWSDSSYSKNINFNITFTSPYGDPLSIFKYVYVPFCALLCFALPRQASENGYLSPFFVRADVPGIISSDLGIITDLT